MQRRLMAIALMFTLAGCGTTAGALRGTEGTTSAKAKKSEALFPTQTGYVWTYNTTLHPTNDPYVDIPLDTDVVELESVTQQGDATTLKLRSFDQWNGEYRYPFITLTKDKVQVSGVSYLGAGAPKAQGFSFDFLRLPLQSGAKWDDGNWMGRLKGKETVTVPAGTFDAYKVDVIGTYDHAYSAVGYYWIAPGTGIVKSELSLGDYHMESELAKTATRKR